MLTLSVLSISLAVARLDASLEIPSWAVEGEGFFSVTKTSEELSIVCSEDKVPQNVKVEKGWGCLKVEGPLDFGLTGILSSLTQPLAEAKISVFAISTFDTDYIMIKKENLHKAIALLSGFCEIMAKTEEKPEGRKRSSRLRSM